jgi:hypothetical protein
VVERRQVGVEGVHHRRDRRHAVAVLETVEAVHHVQVRVLCEHVLRCADAVAGEPGIGGVAVVEGRVVADLRGQGPQFAADEEVRVVVQPAGQGEAQLQTAEHRVQDSESRRGEAAPRRGEHPVLATEVVAQDRVGDTVGRVAGLCGDAAEQVDVRRGEGPRLAVALDGTADPQPFRGASARSTGFGEAYRGLAVTRCPESVLTVR